MNYRVRLNCEFSLDVQATSVNDALAKADSVPLLNFNVAMSEMTANELSDTGEELDEP